MNDDIDKYIKKIQRDIEAFDENQTYQNALSLLLDMTLLKLLIGSKFDELYAFVFYEKLARGVVENAKQEVAK